ncbi:MAG: cupin domain-containing protein [Solirubrobacteraceae bacterium]|nr:cupin domain-containing protein [Solirubrobacteraceae bacterium]
MSPAPDWYVLNVADASTVHHERAGKWVRLERPDQPFAEVGVNIRVLEPGDTSGLYHAENVEEHFLVISGHCLALIGGQERELGPWDFVHVPPGVSHTFVGAGDGPCSILMMGARTSDRRTFYPHSELAARHGASSPVDTEDSIEAYADWAAIPFEDATLDWPPSN